jgi:hypothetical protein
MIHFIFPFTFKGCEYKAGCQVIPGPKRQFHITPYDDRVNEDFGAPILIIEHEPEQFTYGSTPKDNLDSSVLASCLFDGLDDFRRKNPLYSLDQIIDR